MVLEGLAVATLWKAGAVLTTKLGAVLVAKALAAKAVIGSFFVAAKGLLGAKLSAAVNYGGINTSPGEFPSGGKAGAAFVLFMMYAIPVIIFLGIGTWVMNLLGIGRPKTQVWIHRPRRRPYL